MNGNETGTVEYSTELAFNSNLPNLIVLNVAFYMHLIRQFGGACKMRRLNQALVYPLDSANRALRNTI